MLYVFGKEVEQEEGGVALWAYYLITGLFASGASYFFHPRNVLSAGASGAIFGLFVLSVGLKLVAGFNLKKLLESFILGQFVWQKVVYEVQMQAGQSMGRLGVGGVSHFAHLAGALAGVLLIFLISCLPGSDA